MFKLRKFICSDFIFYFLFSFPYSVSIIPAHTPPNDNTSKHMFSPLPLFSYLNFRKGQNILIHTEILLLDKALESVLLNMSMYQQKAKEWTW